MMVSKQYYIGMVNSELAKVDKELWDTPSYRVRKRRDLENQRLALKKVRDRIKASPMN